MARVRLPLGQNTYLLSLLIWWACKKPMRGWQKVLFCWFLFCGGALIVGGWGVVKWRRNYYLEPAETQSFVYWFGSNPGVRGECIAFQVLWFWCWSRKRQVEVSPRFSFVTELESLRASPQTYRKRGSII